MVNPPVGTPPLPPYVIEPLGKHDRATFTCGSEPLDFYFRNQATQDIKRRVAKCSVAVEVATSMIAGFYTLSATSLALTDLPEAMIKKLLRYPVVPAVLMGRLAVATSAQGRQLGRALFAHAVEYVVTGNIGAFALVVDAKDACAEQFYARHGFVPITTQPRRLLLPLATALAALAASSRSAQTRRVRSPRSRRATPARHSQSRSCTFA